MPQGILPDLRPFCGFLAISTTLFCWYPASAQTQIQTAPVIAKGSCGPKSGVTIDGETSEYKCDTVIVARTQRGTILIQFADTTGDDGRTLGFGGIIEGMQGFGADAAQLVAVERLYLSGGAEPVPAERGTCILNWTGLQRTGGTLMSVVCGGAGEADGYDIEAVAVLATQ